MFQFLKKERFLSLADQAIFSGSGFLVTLVTARSAEATIFGVYAGLLLLLYLSVNLIGAFVILPLQVSLSKMENTKSYISFSFWLQISLVLVSLCLSAIVFLLLPSVAQNFGGFNIGLSVFFIGFLMYDYFRKLFLSQNLLYKSLILNILTSISQVVALVFIVSNPTLHTILLSLGLAYIPSLLYAAAQISVFESAKEEWTYFLKVHFSQGYWLFFTGFVQWWSSNLFVLASGMFLGVKALGAFRLAQSLFGVLNIVLQTFENYILPRTAQLFHKSKEDAQKYLRKIVLESGFLFGFLLLFIFLFSNQIIVWAGGIQYAEYGYVVKGMSLLYVFIFLGCPTRIAIRVSLLNKDIFFGYVLSLVFGIISYKFLLMRFELLGAIGGLIVSQVILLTYWNITLFKNNLLIWK